MAEHPLNVLWLMSDQHATSAVGCYGSCTVRTPNLDRLAATGVTFGRAYCSYPVCVPARFTMLTGRYPHNTGCTGNTTPLPLRERTAAHHFGHAGYVTGFIGKMHPVDGQTHGFDYYVDFGHYYDYLGPKTRTFTNGMGAEDSGCGSPWITILRGLEELRSPWLPPDLPCHADMLEVRENLPEDHFESFVARETIRLETYRNEPFFVVTSFLKPHNPFAPPAEYAAMYRPEDMVLPDWNLADLNDVPVQEKGHLIPGAGTLAGDEWARCYLAAYFGNVAHLDACVGRVLEALDRLGLAEHKLVLYKADHGEMAVEHGLRGKFCFFEGSARIPLLARLPGRTQVGARSRALVDQADFVPTLLDISGIDAAPRSRRLDGASFAPALLDPQQPGKLFVFGEFGLPRRPFYMRRDNRWKYVYYAGLEREGITPAEELYDMETDPGERHNLAGDADHRGIAAEVRRALLAFLAAGSAPA